MICYKKIYSHVKKMLKSQARSFVVKKTSILEVFFNIFLRDLMHFFVNLQSIYSVHEIASTGQAAIASSTSKES